MVESLPLRPCPHTSSRKGKDPKGCPYYPPATTRASPHTPEQARCPLGSGSDHLGHSGPHATQDLLVGSWHLLTQPLHGSPPRWHCSASPYPEKPPGHHPPVVWKEAQAVCLPLLNLLPSARYPWPALRTAPRCSRHSMPPLTSWDQRLADHSDLRPPAPREALLMLLLPSPPGSGRAVSTLAGKPTDGLPTPLLPLPVQLRPLCR